MRKFETTAIATFVLGGIAIVTAASAISEYAARSRDIVSAEYRLAGTLGR
jgi:hypothetical protein